MNHESNKKKTKQRHIFRTNCQNVQNKQLCPKISVDLIKKI